jgi:hypothetical protein
VWWAAAIAMSLGLVLLVQSAIGGGQIKCWFTSNSNNANTANQVGRAVGNQFGYKLRRIVDGDFQGNRRHARNVIHAPNAHEGAIHKAQKYRDRGHDIRRRVHQPGVQGIGGFFRRNFGKRPVKNNGPHMARLCGGAGLVAYGLMRVHGKPVDDSLWGGIDACIGAMAAGVYGRQKVAVPSPEPVDGPPPIACTEEQS